MELFSAQQPTVLNHPGSHGRVQRVARVPPDSGCRAKSCMSWSSLGESSGSRATSKKTAPQADNLWLWGGGGGARGECAFHAISGSERLHLEGTTEAVPLWACTGWKRPNGL